MSYLVVYLGVDSVRTLSVYVSSLVSIYVISCLCVVRNFDFCLALACVYFMSNLSCVNLACLALCQTCLFLNLCLTFLTCV